jgi:hypothetical protein
VLLKHKQGNKLVTMCLFPVLYIPQSSSHLLSMGEFFQHGLSVQGDKHAIHLTKNSTPLIICLPLGMAQTLYWLDTTVCTVKQVHQACSSIYAIDYDTMHKHLGHPSRDILMHARSKTKGFPENVTIPTNAPVCPSCAQGRCLHLHTPLLKPE